MFDTWVVGRVFNGEIDEDFLRLTDYPEYDFNIEDDDFKNAMISSTKDMSYRLKIFCSQDEFGSLIDDHKNLVKFTIITETVDFTAVLSRQNSKYSSYLQIIVLVSENKTLINDQEIIRCKCEIRRFLSNFVNFYSLNKLCEKKWINQDKIIKCVKCSKNFFFFEADQEFYDFKNWDSPIRCKNCRLIKNEIKKNREL